MKEKLLRSSHAMGLAVRIIVSVLIIAVIIWKYDEFKNIDIRALIEASSGVFAAVAAILGIYLLKSLVFVVPASLIYIAVGLAFPTHWAILINAVGILIEVSATYLFGLIMGGPYVINKLKKIKYGDKILELHGKNKLSAIFAIRALPVFPIDIVSLFLGAVRMRFLPYILLSLGGILPRVILFTILGDGLYDYVPMQQLVGIAAILLPIALVIWVVRYAMKSKKKEDEYGKPPFEPLKDSKRSVIFDTDIGPDCDDAGAFAVMAHMAEKHGIKILGAANCTSNPYGTDALAVLSEHFGLDIPLGEHKGYEILKDSDKYNKPLAKKYDIKAKNASLAADFYKKLLSKADDDSVTVISVGPLTNLAEILEKEPKLFNSKVNSIVAMAGKFPSGKEFNIECDPKAATTVFEGFKNVIVCSGFEIGHGMMTGFSEVPENDSPVYDCYKEYLEKKEPPMLRDSWDLTAVHYAFEGCGDYYSLSKPVKITVDSEGMLTSVKDKYSNRYYLKLKAKKSGIAEYLNAVLAQSRAVDNTDSEMYNDAIKTDRKVEQYE
ncbi:MAG: nucleoside hydrolase [Clostridia bacterium]|nr:nucleoside hydrolase [Clostridia bacterium]MBQ7122939.1 nucleoside hydrolase [Clostridia bacterium]